MVAHPADLAVHILVVRDHRAAVSEGAEVLLDDEAGANRVAQLADLEAVARGPERLRVVFDDQQLMLVGDLADGLHVGALAVQVDRHDGLGLRCDGRFDLGWVDTIRFRVRIDENSRRPRDPHGLRRGEERVGGGDALVSGTDAQGHEGQPQCVGSVADADGVFHPVIGRQLRFEALEHRPHHVLSALQDFVEVRVYFRFDVVILLNMSIEGHFHEDGSPFVVMCSSIRQRPVEGAGPRSQGSARSRGWWGLQLMPRVLAVLRRSVGAARSH